MVKNQQDRADSEYSYPVPAELPPIEGLEKGVVLPPLEDLQDSSELERAPHKHSWLWTAGAALGVVLVLACIIAAGVKGVHDGLLDRSLENQRQAREHYESGLAHLEQNNYELAVAEFKLAVRLDPSLQEARARLAEAEELAKGLVAPTSEARQDAAQLLYRQAVAEYEQGELDQAIAILDELRGLDPEHQRENVEMMLSTSHYQLGFSAVASDRMDEAKFHFQAVLGIQPENQEVLEQLNLIELYTAALSHWNRDWSAAIQALKGLYTLAPDYKDVRLRLREAYVLHATELAEDGDWCRAEEQYAAAVEIFPQESTVDMRDEASIQCQAAQVTPTTRPSTRATPQPQLTVTPSSVAQEGDPTPQATGSSPSDTDIGQGRIAFTSYDATRQRSDVYVIDLEQGDARLVREHASQPAFSPNGQRLAFRNQDPSYLGLGIITLSNNEFHELTAHEEDTTPFWSSDGNQIVFASNKEGDRKWRIYVIPAGEVRGDGEEWIFGTLPAWSHDGNQVAYHGCNETGDNCSVWIMRPGGAQPTRLSSDASDTAPAWSADDSQVAFASARSGNWDIYSVNVDSGEETQLTDSPAADMAPVWSPDGSQIAFLSNRDGAWAVHVLQVRSGETKKIIATGDNYLDPNNEKLSWTR